LLRALVPPDDALTVAIEFQTRGYSLPIQVLTPGRVAITWLLATAGGSRSATLIATGATRFRRVHRSQVTMTLTRAGQQDVKRRRALKIVAEGAFTPDGAPTVRAVTGFTLR
jgi:hypothetical protein